MPTKTTNSNETMSKKKSIFGSFSDRRSRRSLVYNIREAESLSSDSGSIDPIEEKLDKLSDDLHSLQNTLRAVAHRVKDLEQVISEKQVTAQNVQEGTSPPPQQVAAEAQMEEEKRTKETSLRKRKPTKHDINPNLVSNFNINCDYFLER